MGGGGGTFKGGRALIRVVFLSSQTKNLATLKTVC